MEFEIIGFKVLVDWSERANGNVTVNYEGGRARPRSTITRSQTAKIKDIKT